MKRYKRLGNNIKQYTQYNIVKKINIKNKAI